ncbi:MAG: DUF2085 domain-containing protein [Candidatus Promineifilaceae bacterium]
MASSSEEQRLTGTTRSLVIGIDRAVLAFSKHWLALFNGLIFLYVALPILAPALMNAGLERPARLIYTAYSPMCHQMAQRSFFLFGEQPVYPSAAAGTDYRPLEAYMGDLPEFAGVSAANWPAFFAAARDFLGNKQMGYKMALCERDIAIYGFVLVGGLLYAMLRKQVNIRPLPLLLFVIVGMGPIALDGFSQLFGYLGQTPPGAAEPSWLTLLLGRLFPLRESPPLIRTFTGAWFGLCVAWLVFPQINGGMANVERELDAKLGAAGARPESAEASHNL